MSETNPAWYTTPQADPMRIYMEDPAGSIWEQHKKAVADAETGWAMAARLAEACLHPDSEHSAALADYEAALARREGR